MNHEMGLFPENFEKVKSGQKRREYRLYDEKRQKITPGDTIAFHNTQSSETVTVLVENIHVYKSFRKCYQELICKGWFQPPNTYDCGSFVVN